MSGKTKAPRSRPVYKDDDRQSIVDAICERLMDGESLRSICASKDMPNKATVIRWMNADDEIATTIARAREFQGDVLFDDIQDVTQQILDGKLDPQAARVVIWAKQWSASKLKPKKYGDKLALEGGDTPIQVQQIERVIIKPKRQ